MTSALQPLHEFEKALNSRYAAFSVEPADVVSRAKGRIRDSRTLQFGVAEITVSGITSHRSPLPTPMQDRIHLLMCRRGRLRIDCGQSHIDLEAGDACILDSAKSYVIEVAGQCSARTLEIMRSSFLTHNCPVETVCGRHYRQDDGIVRIITSIVDNLTDDPGAFVGDEHELLQDMLARLLINGRQNVAQGTRHGDAPLLDKMHRWIADYPEKADLSPHMLALQFGMSRRSLYRIFAQLGMTPAQWLWGAKLDQSHAMILDPACRGMSVSSVAYKCGFQGQSHFSRAFKKRFGSSPSALRPN